MEIRDFVPLADFSRCKSLMCIQPHPDDNEIGAAATIAKLAANGCKVTYVTVTDGRKGTVDPLQDAEELVRIRKSEAEEAARLLGVTSSKFLGFHDGEIKSEKELFDPLLTVIRKVKPEYVLTVDPFLPYEFHPDHRFVGMAAAQACMFSSMPNFTSDGGKDTPKSWSVTGVVFHSTARPNTFVNIDDWFDWKVKAIAAHKSQFSGKELESLKGYLEFKSRQYGEKAGSSFGEAFKVLYTSQLHMCVDTENA